MISPGDPSLEGPPALSLKRLPAVLYSKTISSAGPPLYNFHLLQTKEAGSCFRVLLQMDNQLSLWLQLHGKFSVAE